MLITQEGIWLDKRFVLQKQSNLEYFGTLYSRLTKSLFSFFFFFTFDLFIFATEMWVESVG